MLKCITVSSPCLQVGANSIASLKRVLKPKDHGPHFFACYLVCYCILLYVILVDREEHC